MPIDEERRLLVSRLLDDCLDQKLLHGGTKLAIAKARQALEAARAPAHLPSPWPELAAYRLAHLLLRSNPNGELLREVDSLLSQSSKLSTFTTPSRVGLLATIYRLPVLYRLASCASTAEKSRHDQAIVEVMTAAIQQVHRLSVDHSGGEQVGESSVVDSESHDQPLQLQIAAFNLLEFAGYFMGTPYKALEGLASLERLESRRQRNWYLIGRGIFKIDMVEELARHEFEARTSGAEELVLIEFGAHSPKIRLSNSPDWQDVPSEQAKLILVLLEQPAISDSELRRRVTGSGGEDPDARFRQTRHRTKLLLQKLLGRKSVDVFDNRRRLADSVKILGLVHGQSFYRAQRA